MAAPIPAARTRIPPVSPRRDTSAGSSTDEDDMSLDGQSLEMFTSRNELDQATKTLSSSSSSLVAKQLELQSRQQAESERLKLAQEERKKVEEMLAREKTMEEEEKAEPMKRKKWDRPPEIQLELLAKQNESSSNNSDDDVHLSVQPRKLRAPSRGSSVSEFFSLSEDDEDDDLSPIQQAVREEDEYPDDPDAAFAAMCIALARRKQQGDPELPVEDDELDSAGSIRRSCSEPNPGWISDPPHPSSARRSGSFDGGNRCPEVSDDLQIFPPLSNSFFSSVL